jgi:hypothetical protein
LAMFLRMSPAGFLAYPSKYNELKSAEPVIAYATDVQNPLIVLKENNVLNRLYSDGKLKWKLKKDGKVIEEQEVYAGWENRASASFKTKVLPGNTYNLVLDYEKTKVTKETVVAEKTIHIREKYYSNYTNGSCPGLTPKTIGGYKVIKIISSRRYSGPAMNDNIGKNFNEGFLNDKIKKDLRFGPAFLATESLGAYLARNSSSVLGLSANASVSQWFFSSQR